MVDLKSPTDFKTIDGWSYYISNYAEHRFVEECSRRDYSVFKPQTVKRYDYLVEMSDAVYKVQVKAISKNISRNKKNDTFRLRSNAKYREEDFDFLAVYLVENDSFYFIPRDKILDKINKTQYIYDSDFVTSNKVRIAYDIKEYKIW